MVLPSIDVEGAVDDRLGDRLLALVHDGIHEFRENDVAILGVRNDLALFGAMAAGHLSALLTSDAWRRISNGAACGP